MLSLNIIAKVAKLYLKAEVLLTAGRGSERAGYCCDEADFGLMWDFMSLHQKPVDGGERTWRSILFKLGLGALPIWYGHAETVMWMQPSCPTALASGWPAGLRRRTGSGWCFVESSVSAGVKHGDRRLNLSLRTKEAMGVPHGRLLLPDSA